MDECDGFDAVLGEEIVGRVFNPITFVSIFLESIALNSISPPFLFFFKFNLKLQIQIQDRCFLNLNLILEFEF